VTQAPVRKLAVLLHADIVGSTSLVQINETIAHERIQDAFHRLSATISNYGGIAHEIRGDALIAEFARASDAVTASLAFQATNATHNERLSDEIRPMLRIGIAMGEVIVADSTVTGEGIVLAQRLEQLARPGGVVVQGSVSETVPTRMPFVFESLGEQSLKGFDQPVRAYTAILQPEAELPSPNMKPPDKPGHETTSSVSDNHPTVDVDEKPSIAVLPFDNMSGDPEQEFFADGIAEDIITALSRFHDMLVIARNSSFVYRGSSVDVRQVGRELDVRYVLEGSVRSASNRVRITAQLIDACSGNHLWAERFDRSLEDVFEVQDEITALVASTVSQQVSVAEYRSALNRTDQDLDYRGLYHRGMWHTNKVTALECVKAREYALQVLDRFPEHVGGYSLLAYVNIMEFIYGWGEQRRAYLIPDASECAVKGIRIDPDDEMAHTVMAAVNWMSGKHDAAIEECETVLRLNPNFAYAHGVLGIVHAYSGSKFYQQAVECLDRAIRLSPNDPWLQFYFAHRGTAEFFNQNLDAAIEWYHRSIQRNPDLPNAHRWLAATLALKGETEESRHVIVDVLRIEPNCSISNLRQRLSQAFRYEKDFDYYIRGLQLAGLPEE
jgi:TolB-like protein/class 3 adenylate cyclase/tetratricopeptide (TPR) repeat protein